MSAEELIAELADLRKDALRYRWLRKHYASVGFCGHEFIWDVLDSDEQLDKAIDAMQAAP